MYELSDIRKKDCFKCQNQLYIFYGFHTLFSKTLRYFRKFIILSALLYQSFSHYFTFFLLSRYIFVIFPFFFNLFETFFSYLHRSVFSPGNYHTFVLNCSDMLVKLIYNRQITPRVDSFCRRHAYP